MTPISEPAPLKLQLLGGVDLSTADGQEVRAVLRQPKRLALLAFLRLEGAASPVRRDELVAMFWPEADESRGRASLRQALRFLRSHLGAEVLPSRGRREVGVEPEAIWCDVEGFLELHDGEAYDEAVALYGGDLLPGFFLDDSSTFQEWLDRRRRELKRLAGQCAWALAERLEEAGDRAGAARSGKQALSLSPFDEIHVRRLMELLIRVGDHGGALRAFRGLETRLRERYGGRPSEETRTLAESLKTLEGPPSVGGSGGRRSGRDRRIVQRRRDHAGPPEGVGERRSGKDRREEERRSGQDRRGSGSAES